MEAKSSRGNALRLLKDRSFLGWWPRDDRTSKGVQSEFLLNSAMNRSQVVRNEAALIQVR